MKINFALVTFSKMMNFKSVHPSRQPNCLELPLKDGREKESGTFKNFKGDSELTSQT